MSRELKLKFKDCLTLMRENDYVTEIKVWLTQEEIIATLKLGNRLSLELDRGKLYFVLVNGSCIVFNKFRDESNKLRNELDGLNILGNLDGGSSFYSGRYKHIVITPFGVSKVLYDTKLIDFADVTGLIEVDLNISSYGLNQNTILIDDKNSNLLNTIHELIESESEEHDALINVDNFIDSYGSVKTYYDSSYGQIKLSQREIEDLIELEPTKEPEKNRNEEGSKLFTI